MFAVDAWSAKTTNIIYTLDRCRELKSCVDSISLQSNCNYNLIQFLRYADQQSHGVVCDEAVYVY